MTKYFSPSTLGFYDSEINLELPNDVIEITDDKYIELLNGRANGKTITLNKKGIPVLVDKPGPNSDQIISNYNFHAQQNLDNVAKNWGYDSLISATSYVNSSNPQYKADAEALIVWRDSYWTKAYEIEAGKLPSTVEEFISMLPLAPEQPKV